MKKLSLLFLLLAGLMLAFSSCEEDEETPDGPSMTSPAVTSVQAGNAVDVSVSVEVPGGFSSASVTNASGGTATVKTPLTAGATSGAVVVEFTAGTTTGAGTFTLQVTDQNNKSAQTQAAVNISASAVPTISGIPASASVDAGGVLGPVTATVAAEDGLASLTITKDGEVYAEETLSGNSAEYEFSYPTTREDRNSDVEFVFTVEDANGDETSFTHVLTVGDLPTKNISARLEGIARGTEGAQTVTFYSDTIYVLNGFIFVNSGETLNIEPGTVIKADQGQGTGASALIVARGGKINAEGTAEEPIIFTTILDDTDDPDDLPITTRGEWGGLIVLGSGFVNTPTGTAQIEGIPDFETRGEYGGGASPVSDDNSGMIKYVSIRHGGTNIGDGNEINGLTMGGVGSGTEIGFVEVWGNDDDGFEWFGGTVNTNNLLSIYNQDDAFDWDFGWRGQNQFWVVYQEPNFEASDRGLETDGAASSNLGAAVFSQPTIFNMTAIGRGTNASGGLNQVWFMTEGTGAFMYNSIFTNFRTGITVASAGATGATVLDRLANGDIRVANNIWWQIADNTLAQIAGGTQPLIDHLSANNNWIEDPMFTVWLPASGSPAFTREQRAYPDGPVNGFTYEAVDFIGAFGEENWAAGWTAADHYEVF